MKTELSIISDDLNHGIIDEKQARTLLLGLLGVGGSNSNKCEECSKELESGTVFCSADCRIHYYR